MKWRPLHPSPRASIIVPTIVSDPDGVERCLMSVQRNVSEAVPYELLLVRNGNDARCFSPEADDDFPIRLISTGVNRGFAGGCNLGARMARGEHLVLLNDDTEVEPGWLESLLDTADRHPEAGAVGSAILRPDGTLQEVGSLVWRDGTTVAIGRGESPDRPEHRNLRRVDYCSGASLLVRRELWELVGGLDEAYHPAYYEDVDLCFSLQQRGTVVLCQPRSRVLHRESTTAGSDLRTFLLRRNRRHFITKWTDELEKRPMPDLKGAMWRVHGRSRSILIIDDRSPQRAIGSGFGLLVDALEEIVPDGYRVSVACSDRLDGELDALWDRGIETLSEPPELALSRPQRFYDVVLISRPHNFARYAPVVRSAQPKAALVYLAEALFHLRLARQIEFTEAGPARDALKRETAELRELERRIAREADRIVCVSGEEAKWLGDVPGARPVTWIPPLMANAEITTTPFDERRDLVFVAGWLGGETSPNADGMRWFATEVLPRLRRELPGVRLLVTGDDPPATVRGLRDPGIRFLGRVAELASVYGAARIVVVPLRYGSGVKIKCLEALQHGVPVVATPVGAEGLGDAVMDAIEVANDADEFVTRLTRLYTSRDAWERRRNEALAGVEALQSMAGGWSAVLRESRAED